MKLKRLINYLFENEEYSVSTRKHMRKNPLGDFVEIAVEEQSESDDKPKGFWYDCDNEWSNWVEDNMPEWKGEHVYSIKLDHSKMLVIRNLKDLEGFTEKYQSNKEFGMINWRRVAADFSGIEICPYIRKARLDREKYSWYMTWDVASGCIWKKDIIDIESEKK